MAESKKRKVEEEGISAPQVPLFPEPAEYEIAGRKYVQDYLTIPETIQVTKLFRYLDYESIGDPFDFVEQLVEKGVFDQFLNIVLKGDKKLSTGDLRPKQALEVIADFFYLNEVSEIIEIIISRLPMLAGKLSAIGTKQ